MINSTKLIAVGVACAGLGAGGGAIVNASASGPGAAHHGAHAQRAHARHHHRLDGLGRRVVHADLVLARRDGTFATATLDRGTVKSVTGNDVTIGEGARRATWRSVTITVPAGARVRDNGAAATLANVRPGQRIVVFRGPKMTRVVAHDRHHRAAGARRARR